MKKMYVAAIVACSAMMVCTGCSSVGSFFKMDKEENHEFAVDKTFDLLNKSIEKKLAKMLEAEEITQAEHDALLIRWTEQASPALRKLIDDMHARWKAEKQDETK